MKISTAILSSLVALAVTPSSWVLAQDGTPNIPTTSTASTYSCDSNTCKLPSCLCASQSPPNGLKPADVPQFVTITFDDSIQAKLVDTAHALLNVRQGSWYVSMEYTDFSLVQQWYANGHEVADHTFSHVGIEIQAARAMLNQYAGVPLGKIQGFRAPFLNYTADTLTEISKQGFLYDSSATAVTDDCYWPYTLDNGMANDCWTGVCSAGVKLPGVWEIPMYAVLDNANTPQLMDVYLAGSSADVATWTSTNFERHYNGNRQPFGIYVHPTHLTTFPGVPQTPGSEDPEVMKKAVVDAIQSITSKPDVWVVSNAQLLEWMKNPVPASQLAEQSYMKCDLPNTGKEICNGLQNITVAGVTGVVSSALTNNCNFNTTNWGTCFNCPSTVPSLDNPTPPAAVQSTDPSYRHPVPDNCDSIWWDPVAGQCLCTQDSCAYKDTAVPVNNTKDGGSSDSNGSNDGGSAAVAVSPMVSLAVIGSAVAGALSLHL
ncbi:hypothetical protein BDB00DRAFT_765932 [Zychaea mexicana]|uniref:uncharacterized protein n=1 Tax=Zychaea mexicana TaxID=64656 RepID=UPI0022FEBBEF|nr:uncharacterized protein BDB00DRAFT_765932 [Zychaea mexicana]KAI9492169.1 hypothetical protein BDB00DRAFT_765932 [Zychaea mexicana]